MAIQILLKTNYKDQIQLKKQSTFQDSLSVQRERAQRASRCVRQVVRTGALATKFKRERQQPSAQIQTQTQIQTQLQVKY